MNNDDLPDLPPRAPGSHKGDHGRVLVVAGSRGMVGAACLTAGAALRSGAGLVTLATPSSVQPIAAAKMTSAMTLPLPETAEGTLSYDAASEVLAAASDFNAIALGPGLSIHSETVVAVRRMVHEIPVPLVVDADGLNAIGGRSDVVRQREATTILTPHPGEYRRLDPDWSGERDERLVGEFARFHSALVILKGHGTIITDGTRCRTNTSGNPGMATGGSGDVLTGIVAGLLAGGLDPFDAACLAVHIHGRAGDLARDRLGEISMIADDILDHLAAAFMEYQGWKRNEGGR